jgi:hypothetical protein
MKTALLQSEKHLLETGECCPDPKKHGIKDWRETGEGWVRPFTLVSPGGRDELQALWLRHKDSIMKDWKGPSKPWAQEEFEGGKDAT